MPNRNRLAILGVGNVLCTDDGLGPRAVERLSRDFAAPEGVAVLDGGTLGLSLLPIIEDSDQVLIVDAIRTEGGNQAAAARRLGLHRANLHRLAKRLGVDA